MLLEPVNLDRLFIALAGEYPGPSPEAKDHLNGILDDLGLSDYAYQA